MEDLRQTIKAIKAAGCPYRYIAIDTISKLEELVLPLALEMYKNTTMGKNFKGTDILTLPNGGGYHYLRQAFGVVLNAVADVCERIILVGHLKERSVDKEGKEIDVKDINLTGKIKAITCSEVDAIAYMHRIGRSVFLNFNAIDEVICGARPEHLKGREIEISKLHEDGTLAVYWDRIYID